MFEGGGQDMSPLIRVASSLLEKAELYCGGGKRLNVVLGRSFPYFTAGVEKRFVLEKAFPDAAAQKAYLDSAARVLGLLHSLLALGKALSHCTEKDDSNRLLVYDLMAEASCWLGALRSPEKIYVSAVLAAVEGNWKQTLELLEKGSKKKSRVEAPEVSALRAILEMLVGTIPSIPESLPVAADLRHLASRCNLLGMKLLLPDSELPPTSIGGLLELADRLFVLKKYTEATVLLDRCEEVLAAGSDKRVRLERCGIRNYRAELLYQRGRLRHVRNERENALHMYEACLNYCPQHLPALYQLQRLRAPPSDKPLAAMENVCKEACRSLAAVTLLRNACSKTSFSPDESKAVMQAFVSDDDLEALRLKIEALMCITEKGCGGTEASRCASENLMKLMQHSALSVPAAERHTLLKQLHEKLDLHSGTGVESATGVDTGSGAGMDSGASPQARGDGSNGVLSEGIPGSVGNPGDNGGAVEMADEEDLFGETAAIDNRSEAGRPSGGSPANDGAANGGVLTTRGEQRSLTEADVVYLVLMRRTIPLDWVILYAKFTTASGSCNVATWDVIRRFAKHRGGEEGAEIGTLTALYSSGRYDELHSRLKKVVQAKNELSRCREVVVLRILHHLVRGEVQFARQIVERALSYVDGQTVASGGQSPFHWQTYAIYVDLLVLTRIGSHRSPLKCKTKELLEHIFKKDSKRRRDDLTAAPMPTTLRSRIQTLIGWILVLQGRKLKSAEKRQSGSGAAAKFTEAKNLGMQAVRACPQNWRAAFVVAEACKGLRDYAIANKIFTLVGDCVVGSQSLSSWREKAWLDDALMRETAYSLSSVKPAPIASQGKLIRAAQSIVDTDGLSTQSFLTKLAASVKDPRLANVVFHIILQYKQTHKIGLPLTNALAHVGTLACLERAKETESIKNPKILSDLISDAEKVAEAYRTVLTQKQLAEKVPDVFVPHGKGALAYLVSLDQPVVGPLYDDDAKLATDMEDVVTKDILEDLPRTESLRRKLEQDIEALIERLKDLQPLVRHEYATACAVREERLRENDKILKDLEDKTAIEDPIVFGFGGAT
ncbi:hypothetical protein GNI_014320 [Gregarina niphandrodes]|uniref:Tetratricopeptide repeat protein n=1 Tax=Gregarina niphandrodes TaxID=110365 RepID=A0A023BCK6_GRENI|nr:hypothetical protein GNI_014320 [Gregarina niphandrodes]EZG83641.1 hypothetical protein GNI_014320 [Gregarina niphandrodes]|eukprot:XP_011128921.1 hypothetical protein GNI_014320 [Gregarina niphandrodes]